MPVDLARFRDEARKPKRIKISQLEICDSIGDQTHRADPKIEITESADGSKVEFCV